MDDDNSGDDFFADAISKEEQEIIDAIFGVIKNTPNPNTCSADKSENPYKMNNLLDPEKNNFKIVYVSPYPSDDISSFQGKLSQQEQELIKELINSAFGISQPNLKDYKPQIKLASFNENIPEGAAKIKSKVTNKLPSYLHVVK